MRLAASLLLLKVRLHWLVLHSQTTATRFWLGVASFGYASLLFSTKNIEHTSESFHLMMQLAPAHIWAMCFSIHGIALWYGAVTRTFSQILLLVEGVLGSAIWVGAAASYAIAQGIFGPTAAGALIAIWLLVRYPTHWERDDGN